MAYTQTEINNIIVNIGCCAGNLAYDLVEKYNGGFEVCDCKKSSLSYLINIKKVLSCYVPVGGTINAGQQSTSNLFIENQGGLFDSIKIEASDGSLSLTVATSPLLRYDLMIDQLIPVINATSYTSMWWFNPDGEIIFRLVSPVGNYYGVTYTISIHTVSLITIPYVDVGTGTLISGERLATSDDVCLSDQQVEDMVQNYKAICNSCSGSNQDA